MMCSNNKIIQNSNNVKKIMKLYTSNKEAKIFERKRSNYREVVTNLTSVFDSNISILIFMKI